MALPLAGIAALLGPIGNILNKIIPDPNERARIQSAITTEMMKADGEFYKAAGSVITAEATGESWMQRNWRPITMLVFVFIIANNYVLVPYVTWLTDIMYARGWITTPVSIPTLEIPQGLWGLLQIGIGGYIGSRGIEKVVGKIQTGGVPLMGGKSISKEDLEDDRRKLLEELRGA